MNKPRKSPWAQRWSVNNSVSDMILNILNSLKNKPENKWKKQFEILKIFLDNYSIDGNTWLLEEISKNWIINFDMIKDDGFDIDQIIWDDRSTSSSTLHNILNNPSLWTIWKDIEKITIAELVKKSKNKVPVNLQTKFDQEVNDPKSLNEFKGQIWNFFEYGWIDENTKEEIKSIKITNKEIVDWLINGWKLQANDISWDYKNRNIAHKKSFDKIITQEYLWWLKDSVNKMEKDLNMLKDTFINLIPNMSWITDKYPYNRDEVDAETLKKINDAQEKWNKEESDKLSFEAYIILVQKKNKKLGDVLSKLLNNTFDFSKLSIDEQNELLYEVVDWRLDEFKKNWIANLLEIDQSKFDKFIRDIFDISKKEIIIQCVGWDIKLWVNRTFLWWENNGFIDMTDFAYNKLPLSFEIQILDENKDLINNSALKQVFKNEISDDWKSINLDWSNIGKLILMYTLGEKSFDKKDMKKENIDDLKKSFDLIDKKEALNNKIKAPITNKDSNINKKKDKEALLEAREKFKDEEKPVQKSWANFLHYLKENEWQKEWDYFWYEWKDMEVEWNNLIIKWDEGEPLPTEEKKEENWDQINESVEKQEDSFLSTWKNIKWYEFPEDKKEFGFMKGTRLFAKIGDTELPPIDVWWDQRIQLEIKNITETHFILKLTWWELAAGDMEGKEFNYPRTKEFLDTFIKSEVFNGEIYKLPEAKDLYTTIWNIKNSWISWIDWIDVFDELELKEWKLQSSIIEWKPEITHFGSMETKLDEKWFEKKEIINYEVKFNSNWTVDVSYNNYKRNMDYNNFLLFISTKRLKPKTKADVDNDNKEIEKWHTHSGSKFKFFWVANIRNMVTWVSKKINEWVKKQIEKQDKRFYNVAIWEWGIANKLQSVIWRIPGVWDALENIDTDFKNTKDKETRDKTEEILKKIEWHNDFGAIFEDPNYLNEILWSGVSLKDMILSWKLPWWLSWDKRFVASAILLAQISKWPWPYQKMESKRFQGIWVKLLLWEPYYSKFMNNQKEIIAEMKAKQWLYWPWFDAQLAAELAKAEMTFIINNVWWRAPWQRLWSTMDDTRPKTTWSDQFAWKLEERFNEYISRTKVEEWAGKLDNVNNFTFAYIEYRRLLEAWRPTKALPYLKKMAQLAKSPDQIKRFKGAILYGMLTWFFLHYTLPSTQVRIQGICRSFGFSPWLWAPHIDHQKKIAHFLNVASKWTFYTSTWYKLSDFESGKEVAYKKFREWEKGKTIGFEKRWDGNASKIDEFLNKGMYEESMDDATINQLKSSSMEAQQEDIDQDISKNSALIKNYPLSLTKWTIGPISRYDNWTFNGKDNDEIQRSQDARNAIAKAIPKWPVEKWRLVYTTKRFLNRFDDTFDGSSKEELVRVLATVKKYKNKIRTEWWNISQTFEWVKRWEINNSDIKNIMWYMTSWKIFSRKSAPPEEFRRAVEAFETMFWDNIDKMDDNFIEQTFGKENVQYFNEQNSYQLVPRNVFGRITEIGTGHLEEYEKRFKNKYMELNNKWVFINKNMKNIYDNLSRKMSCPPLWWEIKQTDKIEWYS